MFLYIDATAGGLLIQVVLGGVAGTLAVAKLFLGRALPFRSRDKTPGASNAVGGPVENDDGVRPE